MKKLLCILLPLGLVLTLAACFGETDVKLWSDSPAAVTILADDPIRAQAVSASLQGRIEELEAGTFPIGITSRTPSVLRDESRLIAIAESVSQGAKIIICIGTEYEGAVYEGQSAFPDVQFLLLDGEPHTADGQVYEIRSNTHCIQFLTAEAGFLAGYGAVQEGYQNLGYCAGANTAEAVRYGYGFLQGAEYAARQLGSEPGSITLRFWYAGEEDVPEAAREKVANWCAGELDLVFACDASGLAITERVADAAQEGNVAVITADSALAADSPAVLCAIEKRYDAAAEDALLHLAQNGGLWDAGQAGRTSILGVGNGISIRQENGWPFSVWTQEDYQVVRKQLEQGEISVEQHGNRELLPAISICKIVE